jgi:cell division protein FtsB
MTTNAPRRPIRILWLAAALAVAIAFLTGPSGLVRVLLRKHEERRLQGDIARLNRTMAQHQARRDSLANPEYAAELARHLLGDSTPGTH